MEEVTILELNAEVKNAIHRNSQRVRVIKDLEEALRMVNKNFANPVVGVEVVQDLYSAMNALQNGIVGLSERME